ncbi:hypothetical protein [Streptomyces natalensis]|uniref:Urease accessory protein UreG n=1 Tax=Streptomyces natalensis ATCC 27448 TaxID=1240678 RepID=A0A0D7CK44_9ACTN|nr:hypothetical protein SNA_19995 [Streptomyces natalensis ATCC 27448]
MHPDHPVTLPHRHAYSATPLRADGSRRAFRVGLGGPVGSGKTDLAPHVGADLATMAADAERHRGDLPVVLTSLTSDDGIREIADRVTGHLTRWRAEATA